MRKNNVPQFTSHSVRDRFLEHASPELVYTIFEKEQVEDGKSFYSSRFSPKIETKLLGRKEPIIDLALASFSCSVDILRKLFLRKDDVLTAALSGNKNARAAASSSYDKSPNSDDLLWATIEELETLFKNNKPEIMRSYFRNPHLRESYLAALLNKEGICQTLNEEEFLVVVTYILSNPKFRIPPKEVSFKAPFHEMFLVDEAHLSAAWGLLVTQPNTVPNAYVFEHTFSEMECFRVSHKFKWEKPRRLEQDINTDAFSDTLLDDEDDEKAKEILSEIKQKKLSFVKFVLDRWSKDDVSFNNLRNHIAYHAAKDNTLGDSGINSFLADHEDEHVRRGFYRGMIFEKYKENNKSFLEYKKYLDKEPLIFINEFVKNEEAYRRSNKEIRDHFYDILEGGEEELLWKIEPDHTKRNIIFDCFEQKRSELAKIDPFNFPITDGPFSKSDESELVKYGRHKIEVMDPFQLLRRAQMFARDYGKEESQKELAEILNSQSEMIFLLERNMTKYSRLTLDVMQSMEGRWDKWVSGVYTSIKLFWYFGFALVFLLLFLNIWY